jgi:hypothetical protein
MVTRRIKLHSTRNRPCAWKQLDVELLTALLTGDLLPALPVRRLLNQPRFQMPIARISTISAACGVSWYNPPLLEIVAQEIVPRMYDIFFLAALS